MTGSGRGRRREGEVLKQWRKRDQQFRYAVRVRWGGERMYVPLGLETEGWNDPLAGAELGRIMQQIEVGVSGGRRRRSSTPAIGTRRSTSSPRFGWRRRSPTSASAPTRTTTTF